MFLGGMCVCVCERIREGGARYMDKGDNGTCLKFSSCCHPGIWKYKIKFFI